MEESSPLMQPCPACTRHAQQQYENSQNQRLMQWRFTPLRFKLLLVLLVLAKPWRVSAACLLLRFPLVEETPRGAQSATNIAWPQFGVQRCGKPHTNVSGVLAGFLNLKRIAEAPGWPPFRGGTRSVLEPRGNRTYIGNRQNHGGSVSTNIRCSNRNSSSHAFSSTVLLPRSSLRLRGALWRSEIAVQRLWRRHDTYKQLLLQIWCINKCAQQHAGTNSQVDENRNGRGISDELLDVLGFAVTSPCGGASNMLLLDGPPYANGEPHMGHAVNKCLKDFAVRAALLQRRCCHMLPGWDCHGLPIELRVAATATAAAQRDAAASAADNTNALETCERRPNHNLEISSADDDTNSIKSSTDCSTNQKRKSISTELRSKARQVALKFSSLQQKAFERLRASRMRSPNIRCIIEAYVCTFAFGVWAHWDGAYKTMDSSFKLDELKLFALLWNNGLVSLSRFPVYWSPASLSSVSESEVTLRPTARDCLYFKLLLKKPISASEGGKPFPTHKTTPWFLVSWTTTPFTIPANRALAVSASTRYAVLRASRELPQYEEEVWLVGEMCMPSFLTALKNADFSWRIQQIGTVSGQLLEDSRYVHPVSSKVSCPVLLDPVVESDKGTSVLHVAPAHSQEDYRLCQRASRSKGLLVQRSDDPSVLVHVPLIPDLKEEAAATAAGAPLLCPVGPNGTFLGGSGSMPFEGLGALKGGEESIIDFLRRSGSLLLTHKAVLPYPYDERSECPLLMRATPQLHFSVQGLVPEILRDVERIRWLPNRRIQKMQQCQCTAAAKGELHAQDEQREAATVATLELESEASPGYGRIRAALRTRPPTWCLSRQRQWGLPIPLVAERVEGPSCTRSQETRSAEEAGWTSLRLDNDFKLYAEAFRTSGDKTDDLLTMLKRRGWCGMVFDVWFDAASAWITGHKFLQQWTQDANCLLHKYFPQIQGGQQQQKQRHQEQNEDAHQQQDPEQLQEQQAQQWNGKERYSCLVVEGSDQSRGWFQSLLLSHAGAREALRRQRRQRGVPSVVQLGDCWSNHSTAIQTQDISGVTGYELVMADDDEPRAGESLEDGKLPEYPFSVVVTHGFVVDSSGNKLSKSKGNGISPAIFFAAEKEASGATIQSSTSKVSSSVKLQQQEQRRSQENRRNRRLTYGADVLRLFVGALDFGGDMACPSGNGKESIVHTASATYIKLRNAFKYLIGSLENFDIIAQAVPLRELPLLDIGMLLRLKRLADDVGKAYEMFQYNKALHLLLRFVSEDLSATYIEIAKDRLYLDHSGGYRRRSCQTVLAMLLLVLTQLLAPLTPHLAEEVFFRMPKALKRAVVAHRSRKIREVLGRAGRGLADVLGLSNSLSSVFQLGWPRMHVPVDSRTADKANQLWSLLLLVRQDLHWLFTRARQQQKASSVGAPRLGSLNELKLSIIVPTQAVYTQLKQLLPQSKLLRASPLYEPSTSTKEQRQEVAERRLHVDDLRWLLQCSDMEIEISPAAVGQQTNEGLDHKNMLASLGADVSKSGLKFRVYRAEGQKCQRCWMRDFTSLHGPSEIPGNVSAVQQAGTEKEAVQADTAPQISPFACERCTDVMRRANNKT